MAFSMAAVAAEPKVDSITATCSIEPAEVLKTAPRPIRIRMNAVDSQKHPLAYVWSGNGGVIEGVGAEITVNPAGLAPGSYRYTGIVQDAYRNRAECQVGFQVVAPPDPLTAQCRSVQEQVEAGQPAYFEVLVAGALGGAPRIQWFSNGGKVSGSTKAELDTTGLIPAEYSVTARVEDGGGRATDCAARIRVLPAPPPLPEPDLINLGQIVFPRNVAFPTAADLARLESVAKRIPTLGKGVVSVEAYAAPDERDAQRLAASRAAAVQNFLVGKGLSEEMIRVRVGLGGRLGGVRNRTLDLVWVPDGFSY
jgi:outer membrane protein OmpA-like peptidoglycan-associated protein